MTALNDGEVFGELRRIAKLLTLIATKDQTQKERIEVLAGLDFQPKEIADLIGARANTVSVTMSRMKKKARK